MSATDRSLVEEQRIAKELRAAGLNVSSVYDLVNARKSYPAAIPVLLRFLPEELDENIKEGVVRALTVPEARWVAAKPLIREFARIEGTSPLKWAIANALEEVADESVLEDILRLAQDKRHGESRQMIVLSLGRFKAPRVSKTLIDLLADSDVAGHAIMALGRLGVKQARQRIAPFLNHSMPWVRAEAKRALAKIDRASRSRR